MMKQTTLFSGRAPLAPIDGNRKRKASEEASRDAPPPVPPAAAAAHWVLEVPKTRWQAAIDRLISGYRDKSGSSYPAASTNTTNCTLGNKGTNRLENGYLQVCTPKSLILLTGADRSGTTSSGGEDKGEEGGGQEG
jgi:hypothetical protein